VNKKLLGGFAAIGLLMAGAANAVPCGWYGIEPSQQCRNGIGVQDSAAVINDNSYFGANNWQFLDRVDTVADLSNTAFWTVVGAHRGLPAGTFTLADGIWNGYVKLAVALKGPGAYPGPFPNGSPVGTPAVNWSLYQLMPGQSLYDWVYGATRSGLLRNLFTITLYGVTRPAVSEPGTIGLLLIGGMGLVLASRKRRDAVAA
jgi:hypothetical protein